MPPLPLGSLVSDTLPQHAGEKLDASSPSHGQVDRRGISLARRFKLVLCWTLAALLLVNLNRGMGHFDVWRKHKSQDKSVNIVLMISDGYGPASHTMARSFYRSLHANQSIPEFGWSFPLDASLVGSHRSRSYDSLITDSAAGATAFACGEKSYNGGIAVDGHGASCGTVFEAAKEHGYLTGVVVTSRLTDATPACFFAHVASRSEESAIASQMLEAPYAGAERTIDLAIGGGGCFFLPQNDPLSCRTDDRDLVKEAVEAGWDVELGETMLQKASRRQSRGPHGESVDAFESTQNQSSQAEKVTASSEPSLPYLSLMTPSNTPYVIDLPCDEEGSDCFGTLAGLSKKAIRLLSKGLKDKEIRANSHKDKKKMGGFMLMIEGSQIDLCQHQNDPACMVREAIAFQEAAGVVKKEVDRLNDEGYPTLLIATSDHETGGLTLGRQLGEDYPEYRYYPERLLHAEASAQTLSARLMSFVSDEGPQEGSPSTDEIKKYILAHILGSEGGLGLDAEHSGGQIKDEEVQRVLDCLPPTGHSLTPPIDNGDHCRNAIAEVASRRAQVGWSTPGHTGVDINLYAYGHGASGLHGNIENTDVSETLRRAQETDVVLTLLDLVTFAGAQIGRYVASLLHLDLKSVSRKLSGKSGSI